MILDKIEYDEKFVAAQCIKDTREPRKFRIFSILLKVENLQRSLSDTRVIGSKKSRTIKYSHRLSEFYNVDFLSILRQ